MGVARAELLEGRLDLLLLDVVIFLVLAAAWQSLPWKHALNQIKEDVANSLEIVSARLLNALVGVNRRVSCSSGQVLSVLVWNMLSLAVHVALGQTEIDDVDVVPCRVVAANQEVVWLNVSMNDSFFVDLFDTVYELLGDHQDSLEVELALASLEKVLKGWSEQVHDHHMEALVGHRVVRTDVVEAWHARFSSQLVDELALPEEHDVLLVLGCFFDLGGIELASLLLLDLEDLSEGSTAESLDDLEASFKDLLSFTQHYFDNFIIFSRCLLMWIELASTSVSLTL